LIDHSRTDNAELKLKKPRQRLEDLIAERTRELRESEEKFMKIFNVSPMLIAITTLQDFRFVDVNETFLKTFAFRREEVIGKTAGDLKIFPIPRQRSKVLKALQEKGFARDIDVTFRTKDQETRFGSFSAEFIKLQDRDYLMTVMTDITDRRNSRLKLAQKTRELKRFNHELIHFAHTVSHDLQEPLSLIVNYLKLLARRNQDKLDRESKEFVDIILAESRLIRSMIKGVLEYSRVGSISRTTKPVGCSRAVKKAIAGLQLSIVNSGAVLHVDPLPVVRGDETQLIRLFQNLISNSLKYCGNRKPVIRVKAAKRKRTWELVVSDNGIGIAPQYHQRVFQLFQRINPGQAIGGTGIGLATCKKIVELHGGRIWVKSKPGKGSDFYFTLPAPRPEGRVKRVLLKGWS
jgi:PAS domain S-box-containing protein